jgi:YD repeat-containing protein
MSTSIPRDPACGEAENNLASIHRADASAKVSYEYDEAGHRVRTVGGVSGVVVEYAYVGDTLVAERCGKERTVQAVLEAIGGLWR